jgi:hypothetical protein
MDRQNLITVMTDVADSLRLPIDLDATLDRITRSAADTIPGIDHASLSVTSKDGQIQTLAPTDQVAVHADELQYELRQGPCYQAATSDPVVQVNELATDARWPEYGPEAAARFGIGAQLAFQFVAEPHARGALNLYANKPHQIDAETRQLGAMFAHLVAVALGWSREGETLTAALTTREVIGQAIGIIIERYRLDPDRAFAFLVRISQTGNMRLHDVAVGVIADAVNKAE